MEALEPAGAVPPFRRRRGAVETAGPRRGAESAGYLINHSTVLLQQSDFTF